jgi:hypothetical protein
MRQASDAEPTPAEQLVEMRALVVRADELRDQARELVAALERNVAELAEVRNSLLAAALREGVAEPPS